MTEYYIDEHDIRRAIIFLPPKYHILLQFDINEDYTIVHIHSDHWRTLAHIDSALDRLSHRF